MKTKTGMCRINRDDGTMEIFNGCKWVSFEPEEWEDADPCPEETEGDRRYHAMRDGE